MGELNMEFPKWGSRSLRLTIYELDKPAVGL
jgi:hypothetical protein